MNKGYKVRLYPSKQQESQINSSIDCSRFIYNVMLAEHIDVYNQLQDSKEELYTHKYITEKEYKEKYVWLKEASSWALSESRRNLDKAYKNFYRNIKKGVKGGFPKFKNKKAVKWCYTENQQKVYIEIKGNKIKLLKMGWVTFRGLSDSFQGVIKAVTVTKTRTNKYFASILIECDDVKKERVSDNIVGIDLGLKELAVCSNGEFIQGIRGKMTEIENRIKQQQRHLSRKKLGSNRYNKCKLRLNKLWEYRANYLDHFQWHLVNKLCSENQAIGIENLNVSGMGKNRKLAHAIQNINWSSLLIKLEQKAIEYNTIVYRVDRWFPSTKLCSSCGALHEMCLSDRIYSCGCGNKMDRDLNASINIRNEMLNNIPLKNSDYKRGETVKPVRLNYESNGSFVEALTMKIA